MKVFAQYVDFKGYKYRLHTLLQFGESWDLICSIVLANPGSAKPQQSILDTNWREIEKFLHKYPRKAKHFLDKNCWFEFGADSTMRQIKTLCSGGYTNHKIELNGIIQLFNVFNIINADLAKAIQNLNTYDKNLCFQKDIHSCFYHKPVYFGFGNEVLGNRALREVAFEIFKNTDKNLKMLYDLDFDKNKFYHLQYINRQYNNNAKEYARSVLCPFVENIKVELKNESTH